MDILMFSSYSVHLFILTSSSSSFLILLLSAHVVASAPAFLRFDGEEDVALLVERKARFPDGVEALRPG